MTRTSAKTQGTQPSLPPRTRRMIPPAMALAASCLAVSGTKAQAAPFDIEAHSPAVDGECGRALNVHNRFPICRSDAATADMRNRIIAFLRGIGIGTPAPYR